MKYFIFTISFVSIFYAQELVDEYIDQVMRGQISEALNALPIYLSDHPNHPGVLYLSGLLETDGALAKEKFAEIYNNHQSSKYSDKSVIKVSEYYYTAGLYMQSAEWLKKIPKYYSRSEYLDKSIKLFINSLVVAGNMDSAAYYVKVFNKQYPNINLEEIVLEVKNDYESVKETKLVELSSSSSYNKKEIKSKPKTKTNNKSNNKNIIVKIQDLLDRVKEDITAPINEYTLQLGAFGKKSNAEYQRNILIKGGYDARIEVVNSSGVLLYVVRTGYFENRVEAKRYQEDIYSRLAVNSIIIKNE